MRRYVLGDGQSEYVFIYCMGFICNINKLKANNGLYVKYNLSCFILSYIIYVE